VSPLLVALLGVLLIPLFLATWRSSLFGLACQGFLMTLIAYRLHPHPSSPEDWVRLIDLAVVRGVVAPLALYTVLSARKTPSRNDVIPPNLLSWTLAFGMVLVAFTFSEKLVPAAGDQRTLVAVVSAGVMLGFLVLASQSGPFSQMIGALRIENAIALLELGEERRGAGLPLQLALLGIFLVTVALFRWYLATLGSSDAAAPTSPSGPEGPTL
jgi:hydrogenase-4 membrane subunit HyfE